MNKQDMKFVARILENLPAMSPDIMQGWIDNPKGLKEFLAGLVPSVETTLTSAHANNSHLRFLQSAALAATKGSVTLADSGDLFTGCLDSNFRRFGTNIVGEDTTERVVDIYEIKCSATFARVYISLCTDPYSLCLTQGQVVEFARSHRALLQQDGSDTFFLFEVKGEIFVASVSVYTGRLEADAYRFSDQRVWDARDRMCVVVPQKLL